jgi:F-type H+-transporting ATPase subunit epsilon
VNSALSTQHSALVFDIDMALPEKIHLVIVTPEKQLFNGLVDQVTVPSSQGYLGILPGHAPLLAELGIGNISYRIGEESEFLFCSWGFAEAASEIDRNRAEQAKSRAERRLASKNPDLDFARAQLALLRALSRLEAAKHFRSPRR